MDSMSSCEESHDRDEQSGVRGGEKGLVSGLQDPPTPDPEPAPAEPAPAEPAPAPEPSSSSFSLNSSESKKTKTTKMSDLDVSMATIISVFQKYSERDGDKHKLKKSEMKQLLQDQLPELLQHVRDPAALDGLMETLDADGDAELDFQEFMTFVSMVTVCCHEFFHHDDE